MRRELTVFEYYIVFVDTLFCMADYFPNLRCVDIKKA